MTKGSKNLKPGKVAAAKPPEVRCAIYPGAWRVHSEITRDYARQMVSEHKAIIRSKKTGHVTEEWQKVSEHAANHYWDCECYAFAAAEMMGVRYAQPIKRQVPVKKGTREYGDWFGDRDKLSTWLDRRR
ncbi:MAG: hypothetical protein GY845_09275 [Planctomycetes bacterium]|nr:hypothetical protein [Planctomycetota bacterium]